MTEDRQQNTDNRRQVSGPRRIFFLFFLCSVFCILFSENNYAESLLKQPSTKETSPLDESPAFNSFTIETDEDSARDSLNRVSGTYDLGFSAPEQTYKSENHKSADPTKKHDPSTY